MADRNIDPRSVERVVSNSLSYNESGVLGKGSAGFVFRGTFQEIPVAVKRIQLASMNERRNKSAIDLQKREEDALRELDHPNVVKLFHVEDDPSFRYFVLELCAASLDQCFLKDNDAKKYKGPMPSQPEVLLQLADGMNYIHSKMLVHRDIKPENILVSYNNPVLMKWSDFGLCKAVSPRGSFSISGIKGTQYWMAPEILGLEDQKQRKISDTESNSGAARGTIQSDIFSLGLVYFTFLTNGLHLFGTKNLITANIMGGKQINLSKLSNTHFAYDVICQMTRIAPDKRINLSGVTEKLSPHAPSNDVTKHKEPASEKKPVSEQNAAQENECNTKKNAATESVTEKESISEDETVSGKEPDTGDQQ